MIHTLRTKCMGKRTVENQFFQRSFVFLLLLSLFSCKTTQLEKYSSLLSSDELLPFSHEEIDWQNIDEGIDFFTFSKKSGGISYNIVRINLENPALEIVTLKSKKTWQKSYSVKSFAKKNNAIVAINTSPFHIKDYILPWSKGIAIGLVVSEGKVLVEPNENYAAIAFYRTEKDGFADGFWSAKIFDKQTDVFREEKLPEEASGGFWTILRDGNICEFSNIKDVRSAVATGDSGRTLYLFAGKNLTYGECAVIFEKLGCEAAMQFDGGSSTQLVVQDKNTIRHVIPRSVVAMIGFRLKS